MLSAKQKRLTQAENDRLMALVADGLTYTAAVRVFAAETGKSVSITTITRRANQHGITRNVPKVDANVRAILHDGFKRQRTARAIIRDVFLKTGVSLSKCSIRYQRDLWAANAGAVASVECDLCGAADAGERFRATPWQIEGLVCGQCRAELMAETRQRRHDKKNAEQRKPRPEDARLSRQLEQFLSWAPRPNDPRHAEFMERAGVVRDEAFDLLGGYEPGLPILDPYFTSDDLRGPAWTHWLKTTLADDPLALLLAG